MDHVMRRMLASALCVLATLASREVQSEEAPIEYKTITIAESNGLVFRLRYLPRASIADEHWLILEIENQNTTDFLVESIDLTIDYRARVMPPYQSASGARLVSCDSRAIFARDGNPTDPTEHRLEAGQTLSVSVPISNQAAGNLLVPPTGATSACRGTISLSARINGCDGAAGAYPRTPLECVPFAFEWERPNVADTDYLVNRLRVARSRSRNRDVQGGWTYDYALIPRLLEIPVVAARISNEELVDLTLWGVLAAEKVLYVRDPRNQAVRNWYRENLSKTDDSAIYRLAESPYAAEFIPTLFSILDSPSSDFKQRYAVLRVLRWRSDDDWKRNPVWVAVYRRAYRQIRPDYTGRGSQPTILIGIVIMVALFVALLWLLNKWGVNKDYSIQARGPEPVMESKTPETRNRP